MMFASNNPEKKDQQRRQRKRFHNTPLLQKLASTEEKQEYLAFENIQKYVRNYIDSELKPHLKNSKELSSEKMLHGFFKGLSFGKTENLQAGIAQKLFGVYEVELTDELKTLTNKKYDFIINIGAAEGLYSLAFEKIWKDTPVYSFEQDYETRELLREVCAMNNSSNVVIHEEFGLSSIAEIDPNKRGLIFCDCEGFEGEIFAPSNIGKFINCDLVIETHDHNVADVTNTLMTDLSKTHTPRIIDQISLEKRAEIIRDETFKKNNLKVQLQLLNENRHPSNRWIIAETVSAK